MIDENAKNIGTINGITFKTIGKTETYQFKHGHSPAICRGFKKLGIPNRPSCAGEKDTPCGNTGYCGGLPLQVISRLAGRDLPIGECTIEKVLVDTVSVEFSK